MPRYNPPFQIYERRLPAENGTWLSLWEVEQFSYHAIPGPHSVFQTLHEGDARRLCEVMNRAFADGVVAGIRRFAHEKDGELLVGPFGMRLDVAVEQFRQESAPRA